MSDEQQQQTEVKQLSKSVVNRAERNLVVSFIQYLRQKVSANDFTDEHVEAIEVSVQCLEAAFDLTDKNYAFQSSKPLLEIFKTAEGLADFVEDEFPVPTQAEIEQANKLKEEGNELVKAGNYQEAVQKYNEAIMLTRDPVYFCNRAAAYCRLEQYDLAIQDCRTALALDPKYAKAYGRMGVALSCQNRYQEAIEAYKHALEIDPNNESYKQNVSIAEEKLQETQQSAGANPLGGLGGLPMDLGGLSGLLNNPGMQQMASEMMSNPNIQNMMSQMMGAFTGGNGGGSNPPGSFDNLIRAGEQIAETLQASNPELVEQLRRQFDSTRGPSNEGSDQQQPPPS